MMEFLVTMTTQIPEGTSAREVDEMRAREAAHTRELAAQGRVLRLWRPPLGPGEWRTIGLFAAEGPDDLELTLASMPLHVWRTDEPTALAAHANDPGREAVPLAMQRLEYLVTFAVHISDGASAQAVADVRASEAGRTRQLAADGALVRLWSLPGMDRDLGLFQASGSDEIQAIMDSLPMTMAGWLTMETLPLTRHPSDPATS